MCLILNEKEAYILTAREDIEVIKYGLKHDDSGINSLPTLTRYLFGKEKSVPEIELLPGPVYSEIMTGIGLYSVNRNDVSNIYYDGMWKY